MLRQSLELGSDIGGALRIFSEEMRDKRLLRAEEAANKLSVKMVLPLSLFIFPVVLLVLSRTWAVVVLSIVWSGAFLAILLKLFWPATPKKLRTRSGGVSETPTSGQPKTSQ